MSNIYDHEYLISQSNYVGGSIINAIEVVPRGINLLCPTLTGSNNRAELDHVSDSKLYLPAMLSSTCSVSYANFL